MTREEAIKILKSKMDGSVDTSYEWAETVRMAIEALKAERPQGKWIRDRYWSRGAGMGEEYGFFYKCSLCEYEVENGYTRCGFNYCPYCGARMVTKNDK